MPDPVRTFPFEAVRDLLGLVRAMYAAAQASGHARRERVSELADLGQELADTIHIASSTRPHSAAYQAALQRAERATKRVGKLVDPLTPAEPLIRAATDRIRGARPRVGKKVESGR